MANTLYNKGTWLVTLLRRHGRLTREQIDKFWKKTEWGRESEGLPRRSFNNLREAILKMFNIEVVCDRSTYEYYLAEDEHNRNLTSMFLHNVAVNEAINASRAVSHLIFLENVPSARSYLTVIIEALRDRHAVVFDYAPYTRSSISTDVEIHPYCLKLFKQRWYVTGWVPKDEAIKTYALDRIVKAVTTDTTYEISPGFDAELYYKDAFGIVVSHSEVYTIRLRVEPRQAKYFRALPLHRSQQEWVYDKFSVFEYRMKISPDLVEEILSHGSRVTVLEPKPLRAMVLDELHKMIKNYRETEG